MFKYTLYGITVNSGLETSQVSQPIYRNMYTKILEVNLFAFAYRLFRRDFSPLDGTYCNMMQYAVCPVEWGEISTKQSLGKCKQINF